jgi:hypothetical protein
VAFVKRRLLVLAAVGIAAIAPPPAGGGESASRTIDQTYTCIVRGVGFPDSVRYVSVLGEPRIARYAPWAHVAYTDGGPSAVGAPPSNDSFGAGFRTGRTQHWGAGATWLNLATCAPTRARAPLASKGLRGGAIARFGESHRCDVPARVRLRVRAVFRSAVTLKPDRRARYLLTAHGRMVRGEVVVRAANGQPIIYATSDDRSGRTAIFTSPSRCFPT